jgi:hypothetical protein
VDLEQARAEKRAEMGQAAEEAYWVAFSDTASPGLPPMMRQNLIVHSFLRPLYLGESVVLSDEDISAVEAAAGVVEALKGKLAAVEAAATLEELEAISWT